jgi:hypothetical protein
VGGGGGVTVLVFLNVRFAEIFQKFMGNLKILGSGMVILRKSQTEELQMLGPTVFS